MLVDFHQLTPTSIAHGVSEYTLLEQEQTVNRNAGLKLLIFGSDASLEVPECKDEFTYYFLSGRGSLAFPKHSSQSRYTIDPDSAAWIPVGMKHSIVNAGEGPFRCLVTNCKARMQRGKVRIVGASMFQVHDLVGFISRTIFSPDLLIASGASRTIGVDLETLTPKATLGSHEHEEEFLYVLRGKGFVKINEKEFAVKPGSVVYTGPHIVHSVHNTENDNFQYLVYEFSIITKVLNLLSGDLVLREIIAEENH